MNVQPNTCNTNTSFPLAMIRNAIEDIEDQRHRLVQLADEAGAIVGRADAENRAMTAEEGVTVDKLNGEFEAITAEIEQREKVQSMRDRVSQPVNVRAEPPPLPGDPVLTSRSAVVQNARSGIVLNPQNRANASRLLLPQNVAADPWRGNSNAFFVAVLNGMAHPSFLQNAYGSEGSGSDGGFAVPPQFYSGVIDSAMQRAELAPRCRLFSTPSAGLTLPMPDVQDRSADIAGLAAAWVAEGQAMTSQAMQWRSVEIKLSKIGLLAGATSELASDGLNFAVQLEQKMSEAAALAYPFAGTHSGVSPIRC